jgi:carbon starvation protein CstA
LTEHQVVQQYLLPALVIIAAVFAVAAAVMLSNRRISRTALIEARTVAQDTRGRLNRLSARMDEMEQSLLKILLHLFGVETGTEKKDGPPGE